MKVPFASFWSLIAVAIVGLCSVFFFAQDRQTEEMVLATSTLTHMQKLTVVANEGVFFPGLCSTCEGKTSYRKLPIHIQASLRRSVDRKQLISLNVIGRANPLNWTPIAADGSFERVILQHYGSSRRTLSMTYKGRLSGQKIILDKFDLKLVQNERLATSVLKSIDL